jgi:hypothetical protein
VGRRLPAGGKSPTRPKERAANAVNGKVRPSTALLFLLRRRQKVPDRRMRRGRRRRR